jgi:proteasome lid subunit RPN8/RPN11
MDEEFKIIRKTISISHQNMPTIKIILRAAFFIFGIVIYNSCKKTDYHPAQVFKTPQERFFALPATANPLVVAIARKMQREEQQKSYVGDFVRWAGYPNWSKAKVLSAPASARLISGSGTVMIPCAKDSESKTSAIVFAKISGTDTVLTTAYYHQYNSISYKSTLSTGLTAENVALVFMAFDMNVYGDSTYYIQDSLLFHYAGSPNASRYVNIQNFSEGRSSVEICFDVYDNDDNTCPPPPSPTTPSTCGPYAKLIGTDCIVIDFSGGGGGIGGGFPGVGGNPASGGGGGGWNDNPCRNIPSAGSNPCSGGGTGPGWVPYTSPPSTDPCSGADRTAGATATLQYAPYATNVASFSPFTSTTQPEEYFLVNEVGGTNVATSIASVSTTGGVLTGAGYNTVLIFHTHPDGGYPFPSAADAFQLANYSTKLIASYVIAYTGKKYAMYVSNLQKFQAFVANNPDAIDINNAGFDLSSTIGIKWSGIKDDLMAGGYTEDEARERALASILEDQGVILVKAAASSNTFKKIGIQKRYVGTTPVVVGGHQVYNNADCP